MNNPGRQARDGDEPDQSLDTGSGRRAGDHRAVCHRIQRRSTGRAPQPRSRRTGRATSRRNTGLVSARPCHAHCPPHRCRVGTPLAGAARQVVRHAIRTSTLLVPRKTLRMGMGPAHLLAGMGRLRRLFCTARRGHPAAASRPVAGGLPCFRPLHQCGADRRVLVERRTATVALGRRMNARYAAARIV